MRSRGPLDPLLADEVGSFHTAQAGEGAGGPRRGRLAEVPGSTYRLNGYSWIQ